MAESADSDLRGVALAADFAAGADIAKQPLAKLRPRS
jgi:hypothetical protein